MQKKLEQEILKHKVISFDIFDTLLVRPYIKPSDLFLHLEKNNNIPLFCSERINAENLARQKNPDLLDITYDLIYDNISDKYLHMKSLELEFEKTVLQSNPEMKQIFDFAIAQNKQVVITSDMYFSTDFINELLQKNGYKGYSRLYVSGDLNKTKRSGTLYKHLLDDLQVTPKDVFHIGDNKKTDYRSAKKVGIKAFLYTKIVDQYLQKNAKAKAFMKNRDGSLGESILLSTMAYKWIKEKCLNTSKTYWHDLGYSYTGPACYGYARFIENKATEAGINNLLFVARDGYVLQKIFQTFNSSIKNSYIYAPRFINLICNLDYMPLKSHKSEALIKYFVTKDQSLKKLSAKEDLSDDIKRHRFIQQNITLFKALADTEAQKYANYLKQNLSSTDKTALVDTITVNFSSQKLLQSFISKPLTGFYWIVFSKIKELFNFLSYGGETSDLTSQCQNMTQNWNLMEFLITSPEHHIKNIDDRGNPVFDAEQSPYETTRSQLYPQICEGALSFTQDINALFQNRDIYLKIDTLVRWINAYINHPTQTDFNAMKDFRFGNNTAHDNWVPLIASDMGIITILKSFKKNLAWLKEIHWRTFSQTLLLCLVKPLRIRIKKNININIFPYLRKKYFSLTVRFLEKELKIGIGNHNL